MFVPARTCTYKICTDSQDVTLLHIGLQTDWITAAVVFSRGVVTLLHIGLQTDWITAAVVFSRGVVTLLHIGLQTDWITAAAVFSRGVVYSILSEYTHHIYVTWKIYRYGLSLSHKLKQELLVAANCLSPLGEYRAYIRFLRSIPEVQYTQLHTSLWWLVSLFLTLYQMCWIGKRRRIVYWHAHRHVPSGLLFERPVYLSCSATFNLLVQAAS